MGISAAEFRPALLMHQAHKARHAPAASLPLLSLKTAVVKLVDNPRRKPTLSVVHTNA